MSAVRVDQQSSYKAEDTSFVGFAGEVKTIAVSFILYAPIRRHVRDSGVDGLQPRKDDFSIMLDAEDVSLSGRSAPVLSKPGETS